MIGPSRRRFLGLIAGASAAVAGAACAAPRQSPASGAAPTPLPATPSAIRASLARVRLPAQRFRFPSPFAMQRGAGFVGMSLLFDQLVWANSQGMQAWAAETYSLDPGGMTVTFHLRPGLQFHDGTPVTARDVAFSVALVKASPMPWTTNLGLVDNVATPDDRTVVMSLTQPNSSFLTNDINALPILPEAIWSNVADPYKYVDPRALVGSGPYRIGQFDPDLATFQFLASETFWAGVPFVREIDYVPTSDPVLALLKGDVDACTPDASAGIGQDVLQPFVADANKFGILQGTSDQTTALYFNHSTGAPLNERAFRQATAHAIDTADLVKRVLQGSGVAGNPGWLAPASKWHNPNVPTYPFDPDLARSMLDQAGYTLPPGEQVRRTTDGSPLAFTLLFSAEQARLAEVLGAYLTAVGIQLAPRSVDAATLRSSAAQGAYQLALIGLGGLSGDPDFSFAAFDGRVPPGPQMFTKCHGYTNAQFSMLQDQQRRALDQDQRTAALFQQQAILATDLPALSLLYPPRMLVYNRQVFDAWYYTPGGIAGGQPMADNKSVFVRLS